MPGLGRLRRLALGVVALMAALFALPWRRIITSRWLHYGALALLLALAWLRGNAWEASAGRWKAAHAAQKSAMVASASAAKARALAARIATENTTADLARRADHAEHQVADLRAAADRFADARRLRPALACRPPGGAAAPGTDGPAPDRDGPGADAVVLTRPEFDEFVAHSLRLERVRQWGESLIHKGLAVPEAEFGSGGDNGETQ